MIEGNSRVLTCPYCGGDKEVLSLDSGNNFGERIWTDNKTVAPMLPKVSYVQQCPCCGKYFLISWQKTSRYSSSRCGETGDLDYQQLKAAYKQVMADTDFPLDERDYLTVLYYLLWGFNDQYNRKFDSPEENRTYDQAPDEDNIFIKKCISEIIGILTSREDIDHLMIAELYREAEDYASAAAELQKETNPHNIKFRRNLKEKLTELIAAHDCLVYEITAL